MKSIKLILILFSLSWLGCQSIKNIGQNPTDQKKLYQASIESSMSPTPDKVYDNLIVIRPENQNLVWKKIDGEDYVLMLTWKQNISYYKPYLGTKYNTGQYPMWVTTAPELFNRIKKENPKDVDLRLKQLLGLPPNATYSYFVEFWVKPQDLFRPCPDQEINDKKCDLCFPTNTTQDYVNWINENRISRYYQCDLYDKYPWSQLGYTYDWNAYNKQHIGLSEFVIKEDKNIIVKAIYTTKEYLNKKGENQ